MIFRVRHQARYVAVSNATVRDPALSLKATGLLVFLLSFPDDATFTREQVARMKTDGVRSVRTGLRELADAGYLTYSREQGPDGRWHTTVVLQEQPTRPEARFAPPVASRNGTEPKARFPTVGKRASKEEVPTTKDLAGTPQQQPEEAAATPPPGALRLVALAGPEDIAALAAKMRAGTAREATR